MALDTGVLEPVWTRIGIPVALMGFKLHLLWHGDDGGGDNSEGVLKGTCQFQKTCTKHNSPNQIIFVEHFVCLLERCTWLH